MKTLTYSIAVALISSFAFISPAAAQTVTGSASVSGNITINATGVFFNLSGTNTPANPLAPFTGNPNTGSFAGLSSGAIKNLAGIAVPGPLAIKGFATFNTPSGTIVFDLQSAAPGSGSTQDCANAAIGNVCTPAGSPLTVIQTAANATAIELVLKGIAYPATAGPGSAGTTMSLTTVPVSIGTISVDANYRHALRNSPFLFRHTYRALTENPVLCCAFCCLAAT